MIGSGEISIAGFVTASRSQSIWSPNMSLEVLAERVPGSLTQRAPNATLKSYCDLGALLLTYSSTA